MTTAVSTYRHAETTSGSFKSVTASAVWLFSALVASSRVAAAVRSHKTPAHDDLKALGIEGVQFPRF